jgi:hypothetical protein
MKEFLIESARKQNEKEEKRISRLSDKPLSFAEEVKRRVAAQMKVNSELTVNQLAYRIARSSLDARPRQASKIALAFLAYDRMTIDFTELIIRTGLDENTLLKYFNTII